MPSCRGECGDPLEYRGGDESEQEHLDYHKTMEEYAFAKRKLIENVVEFLPKPGQEANHPEEDIPFFHQFVSIAPKITTTFDRESKEADLSAAHIVSMPHGSRFWLLSDGDRAEISLPVPEHSTSTTRFGSGGRESASPLAAGDQTWAPAGLLYPGRMEEVNEGTVPSLHHFALTPGAF